jgi:hypothetical protein
MADIMRRNDRILSASRQMGLFETHLPDFQAFHKNLT